MDFEETRLYYSHQQLHQQTNQQQQNHDEINDPTTSTVPPQTIHNSNNEDYDDSQVPVQAVRRHFREFLSTYKWRRQRNKKIERNFF
jgi:hypothetical protein